MFGKFPAALQRVIERSPAGSIHLENAIACASDALSHLDIERALEIIAETGRNMTAGCEDPKRPRAIARASGLVRIALGVPKHARK